MTINRLMSHRMPTGHAGAPLRQGVLGGSVQSKLLKWLHFPLPSKVCRCHALNRASSATTLHQQISNASLTLPLSGPYVSLQYSPLRQSANIHSTTAACSNKLTVRMHLQGKGRAGRNRGMMNNHDTKHPAHLTDCDYR